MLNKEVKTGLIGKYRKHEKDTGSSEVQVALMTGRINYLTERLKKHKKDHSSRRGLIVLVGKRRSLLDYIKRTDFDKYKKIIDSLELRK